MFTLQLSLRGTLSAIFLLLIITSTAYPQTNEQKIEGSVADATGARIPNAAVRVINKTSERTWDIVTDQDGVFRLQDIPFGTYRIEISHPGFTTKIRDDVPFEPGTSPNLVEQLSHVDVAEQVNVTADAQLLQPETSTLTATLNSRTLTALPTASRNYTHLIVTQPGVAAPLPDRTGSGLNIATTPGTQSEDATQSLNPSVNGARPTNNSLRINGIDATNLLNQGGGLGNSLNVPLDVVEA
ncbi:MAG: carboxypeptidase regulatory-like domain-containing protein, partial [Pyrinomonadaceae bacterium]|nr:carboxypeptidase regulatory-like domain-containing protein [Pyrinomonadaceae bacterium]